MRVPGASLVAICGALLLGTAASAAEPTVSLYMDVVRASNQGTDVDPALQRMKQKFAQKGISYQSYKRVATEHLTLVKGHPFQHKLPNGNLATVRLNDVKGNRAHVHVTVPPVDSDYEVGEHGSVYLMAGPDGEGTLIFRLSARPLPQ